MKKRAVVVLFCLVVLLAGCGSNDTSALEKRLDALENQEPTESSEPPAEPNNAEGNTEGDPAEPPAEPEGQTVELPLNSDGTLDMENEVVAKYLPSGNGNSQSVDPDLTITPRTDKSFNERSGRNSNGMSW